MSREERIEALASDLALADDYNPNDVDPKRWAEIRDSYVAKATKRIEMTDQMYLDHGPESFLGEVIGLVKVRKLHIDIVPSFNGHERVLIEFACILPDGSPWDTINSGRSYGEALRRVREALRFEVGR